MERFASVPEQLEAKRLLTAALTDEPAHAYLLHGPPGVGKRTAALAFATALLGDARRVEARTHPDLYVLEPLGEMIRIDDVRALRHDLHMRPFEADRRVYLVLDAERMNEDAADALLKDLEEPPPYAVIVLVASELGPLPPTILSRCQLVPFRRLSERAVREWITERAPERSEDEIRALSRASAGRLDRARRLLDSAAADRRETLIAAARSAYLDPDFEPGEAAAALLAISDAHGQEAKDQEQAALEGVDLPAREADQRVRRAQRGAERDELLAGLEALEAWYRDLVVVAAGAEQRGGERRPAGRPARGRRPRPRGRPAARRGSRSRDLARARGVQPERPTRARSSLRPTSAGVARRPRMVVGLVGCGDWGRHILRDLVALGCDVPVVARSQESIARAEEGGAAEIVASIASLPTLDGAVVATPATHTRRRCRGAARAATFRCSARSRSPTIRSRPRDWRPSLPTAFS